MSGIVCLVLRDSPAWNVFKRNVGKLKPGAIIPVSEEELASLSKDVVFLPIVEEKVDASSA